MQAEKVSIAYHLIPFDQFNVVLSSKCLVSIGIECQNPAIESAQAPGKLFTNRAKAKDSHCFVLERNTAQPWPISSMNRADGFRELTGKRQH